MEPIDKIAPEQFIHGLNECSAPMAQNTDSFNGIDMDHRIGLLYEPPLTYTLSKIEIYGHKPHDYVIRPQLCIRTDCDNAPSRIVLKQGVITQNAEAGNWYTLDLGPVVLVANRKYWLVARAISLTISRESINGLGIPVMVEQPDGKWTPLASENANSFQPILKFYGRILPVG